MGLEIHIRYAIAWVWATVTLVIMIAGAPCPWYEIKASAGSVTATEDFYLDYYELSLLGSTHSCKYSDRYDSLPLDVLKLNKYRIPAPLPVPHSKIILRRCGL